VLFGAEASGLDTASVARAERLVRFDTNTEFPSLNLAQSVLLFGWEWRRAVSASEPREEEALPAPRGELRPFLDRLVSALEVRGFFLTPELRPTTEAILHSLFYRTAPTERELALLQGMLTALLRERRTGGEEAAVGQEAAS
jgi:tRNA/rRNA methyltransferase